MSDMVNGRKIFFIIISLHAQKIPVQTT